MADPLLFQKTLQDLIKGIRTNKKDPSAYVSKAIAEIKDELKSNDAFLKAEAVRKLTYLQMVGYNVSWASFSIVEVMSQSRFAHKRIGYLAANQTFDDSTDVILLTTNLFKKEFSSNQNQYEVAMAANCLANIATKELARDCISDVVTLMNHTKPYIRKKAILAMYKLYVKFPQGLRLTFDKLKERLDDSDPSVVSTAVNVICELANKNPKNYLAMAPKFFKLLTTSSNNWMLIKVVKLLGSLVSEEPRLARKLLEPLATIIRNTGAKSLQYECIYTITEALPFSRREDGSEAKNAAEVIALCSEYLRGFIEDADQNLKYLGLVGLCNLMRSSPRSVVDHRDLVLGCLNDDDVTIRTKALELLAGIASKKSLVDLVHHLLAHAKRSEGFYRDEIIGKILWMCKRDKYSLVSDFAWYTSILLDLAVMQGAKHGLEVADQLMEIALRVESVRPYAVETLLSMLLNENLLLGQARGTVVEVLRAAAWVVGEYSDILTQIAQDKAGDISDQSDSEDEEEEEKEGAYWIEAPGGEEVRSLWRGQPVHYLAIKVLLHPRSTSLSTKVQIVYLQAAMKLFVRSVRDCQFTEVADVIGVLRTGLPLFTQNLDLEVQERATTLRHLLADFQILPLDWERAATQVTHTETSSAGNLLDLMAPVFEEASVRNLDEAGARIAMQKQAVLGALIRERFYAVHSKAQKRVPLPDGLDLSTAFNASAMAKLMKTELPEKLTLSSLLFVKEREAFTEREMPAVSRPNAVSTAFGNALDDIFAPDAVSVTTGVTSKASQSSSTAPPSYPADDIFMLGKKPPGDLVPLSKLLGEVDDLPVFTAKRSSRSKDKKGRDRKEKKGRKEAKVAVEILPAGAAERESSSEGEGRGRRRRQREEEDLGHVDITRPLGEDEVLPVQKHRVVPSVTSVRVEEVATGEKSKEKREKREKRKKKETGEEVADLIALDDDQPAVTPIVPSETGDLLDSASFSLLSGPSHHHPNPVPPSTQQPSSSSKKSKKSKESEAAPDAPTYFHRLYSSRTAEVLYGVQRVDSGQWTLTFLLRNTSSGAVTARLELQSHVLLRSVSPKIQELAVGLAAGEERRSSAELSVHLSPDVPLVTLSAVLSVTSEGLIGPDTVHATLPLHLYAVSTFTPYKLDSSSFAEKVSKASSKWAKRSLSLALSPQLKPKHAFKRLAELLHAYLVEAESSKASTLAAKSPEGCRVFVLVKAHSSLLSVEVKCLGATETESTRTLAAVTAVLEQETL